MPEIKLNLDDPSSAVESLRHIAREYLEKQRSEGMVGNGFGFPLLQRLTDQIERQLPKAPVEEPTGDVLVSFAAGTHLCPVWRRDDELALWRCTDRCCTFDWGSLVPYGPTVYRPEVLRVGVGEPATPPAEAVEAKALNDLTQRLANAADDAAAKWLRELPATNAEPTPEQVEADLAQDEQAHARYYAQPGVPVEKVREVAETLLSLADAPEYQEPKHADVNAVWRQAAQRVAALLPKGPTS